MAGSPAFDLVCETLERESSLDRLESRGTVRLALKEAGLEPGSVTPAQMAVMVDRILPGEIAARGVEGAAVLCASIRGALAGLGSAEELESPETIFARLGGGS